MQLDHLGIIAARGPDARRFLNGQLTQDVLALRPERVELAGLCNAQGRLLAVLHLLPVGDQDVLMILRRELLAGTLQTLRRFVLRAKVTLADETPLWQLQGLFASDPEIARATGALAGDVGAAIEVAGALLWRHAADGRCIALRPRAAQGAEADAEPFIADPMWAARWHAADIAAGLPVVYTATVGEFVAQMQNLDAQGGISFTKGCYTGQEVVARAHYRGRVKRRLQRFLVSELRASEQPQEKDAATGQAAQSDWRIGDQVKLADGRSAQLADLGPTMIEPRECLAITTYELPSLPLSYDLPE